MVIRMKKIISIFIFLLLLVGCSLSNSPTSKVEDLLTKYQTLDKDIVNGINSIIEEENFTSIQKDRYKKIIEKQYKNLTYEIKNESLGLGISFVQGHAYHVRNKFGRAFHFCV